MTIVGEAFVRIRPDDAGFSNEAEKGILSKVGGIASKAAGLFAAGFVAKQGFDFLGGLVKDASESRRVLAETEQAIKATGGVAGVSAKEVAALADSLSKKTGIDDEQIQSAENLLLCLEESAQALTRDRGWVGHTELAVGDDILVYDPTDDSSRWEPIQDFYRYQVDTELIHWKSKQIDVKTTPHHRWWAVGTSGRSEFRARFMTTEQISGHEYRVKIGGARPGGFRSVAVLSDDMVELIGWVVTEGTYQRWRERPSRSRSGVRPCALCVNAPARNTRGVARCEECAQRPIQDGRSTPRPMVTDATSRVSGIVFSQSQTANPKHVARIRDLVDRLVRRGHTITETQSLARYNDSIMSVWSFSGSLAREVRRLLPGKKLTPELLGMITERQAEILLDTMLDGDGHRDAHGHRQYIQKDQGQLDVLAMMCAMLGIRTSVLGRGGDMDALYLCSTNHLKGSSVHAERVRYQGTVWCPQVRTGIFMARNRGRTFWTGNTFKGVRNEAGKGNDIFNQSTAAVLDLSKQFGGVEQSAIQVGKALNDPVAGITALGRAGVTFTDQQKDQIKAMVEVGDTLGAQKIILGEINAQVGGQAAAQATAADKLKVVWGNLREELGTRLLPVVDKVATFLADRLPGALDATGRFLGPIIGQVGMFVKTLTTGFTENEGTPIERFALTLRNTVFPIVVQVIGWIRDNIKPVLMGVAGAFLLAAGPIVAIGAALVLLYTRFSVVRTVIAAVADFLTNTVAPAIALVVGFMVEQFGHLADFVRENWAGIQEAIGHVIEVVRVIIEGFIAGVQAAWRIWGDEILNVVRTVFDQIRNIIDTVIGIISGLIRAGIAIINGDWDQAWDAIKDILATAWDYIVETVKNALGIAREVVEFEISTIVAFIGSVPGKILGALGDVAGILYRAGASIVSGFLQGIKDKIGDVYDFVSGIAGKIADLKGPIEKDRRLLVPAGEAIMEGLEKSIRDRQLSVEARVRSLTAGLASAGVSGGSASGTAVSGSSTFSGTVIGQLTINAPGGNAAEIGSAVEQAVTRLVANGTVGRAMSARATSISRR